MQELPHSQARRDLRRLHPRRARDPRQLKPRSPGIVTKVLNVENAIPGTAPTVTFSVIEQGRQPGRHQQADADPRGPRRSEHRLPDGRRRNPGLRRSSSTPGTNGVYTYTMTNKIPAAAAGSYTVSIEARNTRDAAPWHHEAGDRHRHRQARGVLLLRGHEHGCRQTRGGFDGEVRCLPPEPEVRPRRHPRGYPGVRDLPQSDAGRWHFQAERQLRLADPQHPPRREPGESLRLGNHQLPGGSLPGRSARLHYLPREQLLSAGQDRRGCHRWPARAASRRPRLPSRPPAWAATTTHRPRRTLCRTRPSSARAASPATDRTKSSRWTRSTPGLSNLPETSMGSSQGTTQAIP